MPTSEEAVSSAPPIPLVAPARQSFSLRRLLPMRLDFYILAEVVGPFLGGIFFFIFIFLMFQALRLADFFIVHGVPGRLLLKMVGLMALAFMPTSLPVAFLISVLVAFGRLSSDSELVAMKANGLSMYRLAAPVLAFGALVSCFSLALNLEICPWGDRLFKTTLIRVGNTQVVSSIREGTFTSGFFDLLIFADHVDQKNGHMRRVFIYDERQANNPLVVVASAGDIVPVKTGSELNTAAVLKLKNGSIHRNDLTENTYQKIDFEEYRLFLKVAEGTADTVIKPQMIPLPELRDKIVSSDPTTYLGREFRGELYRRFAVAVTPLIFVFLGMGMATVRTRAVRAGAVLTALVTLFIYWGTQTAATIAMQKGQIPPLFAMTLPDLLIGSAAAFAFWRCLW